MIISGDLSAPLGLLAHKIANALIEDAQPTKAVGDVMKVGTLGVSAALFDQFRKRWRGLWVGGDLRLFDDRLIFSANALNRAVQTGDLSREVILKTVTKVEWRSGFVTGIIDVSHAGGQFTFRCYGARPFAVAVESAVRNAKSAA